MARQVILTEFDASGVSIQGPVRDDNQDGILVPDSPAPVMQGPLFAVADGMGGYANGGLASRLALQNLNKIVRVSEFGTPPATILKKAAEIANLEILKAAQQLDGARMGTTLTAALVVGNWLHLGHVGDSRAYLIRNGTTSLLTNDHTVVGDMVRARILSETNLRTHAQRSVLTRALGLAMFVQLDISKHELKTGDRVILCSDGVWSVIENQEFSAVSGRAGNAEEFSQAVVNLAVEKGSDDNCSAVAFEVKGFRYQAYEEQPRKEGGWFGFLRR